MFGLRGQDRSPRAPVRERRNFDNLAATLDFIDPESPIQVNEAGMFELLLASPGGLRDTGGELALLTQGVIGLDAAGLKLHIGDGLENDGAGNLRVRAGDGLALAAGVLTARPGDGLGFGGSGRLAVLLAAGGGLAFSSGALAVDESTLDHGGLGGLGGDDHPQYLTTARGDARYYTESETDALLADKSDAGHDHDGRYYTEAETDALVGGKVDRAGDTMTGRLTVSDGGIVSGDNLINDLGVVRLGDSGNTGNKPILDLNYGTGTPGELYNMRIINADDRLLRVVDPAVGTVWTMRSGDMGVGVDSPSARLHVQTGGGSKVGLFLSNNPSQTADMMTAYANNNAGRGVAVDAEGNLVLTRYTNANRPSPGRAGRIIYNVSDGQINLDDGADWRNPGGAIT